MSLECLTNSEIEHFKKVLHLLIEVETGMRSGVGPFKLAATLAGVPATQYNELFPASYYQLTSTYFGDPKNLVGFLENLDETEYATFFVAAVKADCELPKFKLESKELGKWLMFLNLYNYEANRASLRIQFDNFDIHVDSTEEIISYCAYSGFKNFIESNDSSNEELAKILFEDFYYKKLIILCSALHFESFKNHIQSHQLAKRLFDLVCVFCWSNKSAQNDMFKVMKSKLQPKFPDLFPGEPYSKD